MVVLLWLLVLACKPQLDSLPGPCLFCTRTGKMWGWEGEAQGGDLGRETRCEMLLWSSLPRSFSRGS